MTWQKQFHSEHSNVQVLGYLAASEEACRRYFRERVSAKLAESDGGEELLSHLVELGPTGFDLGLNVMEPSCPQSEDSRASGYREQSSARRFINS